MSTRGDRTPRGPAPPSGPAPESVTCPHCHAAPGEPCLKPNGRTAPAAHAKRKRDADRQAERKLMAPVPDAITGDRWKRLYRACRMELEQRGDWTVLAGEDMERMVRNLATAETLRSKAELNPLVAGSTHNEVINPAFAAADRLDGRALQVAKAYKLTPDTRGTSAPANAGDDVDPEAPTDEFSELDEVARKRKEKASRAGT